MIITVYFELLPCILNHYREFDDICIVQITSNMLWISMESSKVLNDPSDFKESTLLK